MNQVLPSTGQCWATVLILAIGLSAFGCKDSVSVSEDVQVPLSSLTVTPSPIQPAFSSNTTSYTVEAPTATTSVAVTASPRDSTTTMTINGTPTGAGQERTVPLGAPGSTITISIVLSSATGTETAYTVTVIRLLSSDNNLKTLTVTSGSLDPAFTPARLTYAVDVASNVSEVTVSASKSDPGAVIQMGSVSFPAGTVSGQANFQLRDPGTSTPLPIDVIAPNGDKKTYTITVNRAALSSDNNLRTLTVDSGALSPKFAAKTLAYTVEVASKISEVTVSAKKSDPDAVIQMGAVSIPAGTVSGQANFELGAAGTSTSISIDVTAPNGNKKTYTITVNRLLSSDNNLKALTVTPGPLDPTFVSNQQDYTLNVATDITQVTVTATKSDPDAIISGNVPNEGVATIPLDGPGTSKAISINVAAPNGNIKTYVITVNRAAPSSDNNLSALTITGGSLTPAFTSDGVTYTVDVAATEASVTVAATKSDPNAVISGNVPNEGTATIPLDGPGTSKTISIIVTAANGTPKTYTITVINGISR